MKPIVFLDFDGVMNNMRTLESWIKRTGDNVCIDWRCAQALKKLLDASGADVVISSTWRKFYTDVQLKMVLEVFGLKNARIIGRTPEKIFGNRGQEIAMWLEANGVDRVTGNYVILDDDATAGWVPEMKAHWVQTDMFDVGFRNKHVKQALKILGVGK